MRVFELVTEEAAPARSWYRPVRATAFRPRDRRVGAGRCAHARGVGDRARLGNGRRRRVSGRGAVRVRASSRRAKASRVRSASWASGRRWALIRVEGEAGGARRVDGLRRRVDGGAASGGSRTSGSSSRRLSRTPRAEQRRRRGRVVGRATPSAVGSAKPRRGGSGTVTLAHAAAAQTRALEQRKRRATCSRAHGRSCRSPSPSSAGANGLHPAILSERGLDAALGRSRLACPSSSGDRRAGRAATEQVEVAAYYLVSEALTNVVKYTRQSCASRSCTGTAGSSLRWPTTA
jgi:hypothetical protein